MRLAMSWSSWRVLITCSALANVWVFTIKKKLKKKKAGTIEDWSAWRFEDNTERLWLKDQWRPGIGPLFDGINELGITPVGAVSEFFTKHGNILVVFTSLYFFF